MEREALTLKLMKLVDQLPAPALLNLIQHAESQLPVPQTGNGNGFFNLKTQVATPPAAQPEPPASESMSREEFFKRLRGY